MLLNMKNVFDNQWRLDHFGRNITDFVGQLDCFMQQPSPAIFGKIWPTPPRITNRNVGDLCRSPQIP